MDVGGSDGVGSGGSDGPDAATVLVVDDDPAIRDALTMALRYEGHDVVTASNGAEALTVVDESAAAGRTIDAMLVDLLMPEIDGLSLCRELRRRNDATPILVLTALDAIGDRVAGLDAGADDYLPKPFDLAELLARVRALLRRVRPAAGPLVVGELWLHPVTRRAERAGQPLSLTATEFDLLQLLMERAGSTLSRTDIYEAIWGEGVPVTSRSLDVYIGYLRTKTELGGRARLIETVRGHGFRIRSPE